MVQILLILICPAFISLGLPDSLLRKISNRTTNEARHINRVVRGIPPKAPAAMEWEGEKYHKKLFAEDTQRRAFRFHTVFSAIQWA